MNSSNKSRNGAHNLSRLTFHGLNRRALQHATSMLGGVRRPRQPNELALACRYLSLHLRIAKRMAKRDPHLFGPHALDYYLDTLAVERQQREVQAALIKIYGPPKPGEPVSTRSVWSERYDVPPEEHRGFLKWFRESYPDGPFRSSKTRRART